MSKLINILLFFIWITDSFGQQLPFRHYTTRDGLQSNVCYFFFQDNAGYLWTSTESGLSRFDGRHFTNFEKTTSGKPLGLSISFAQTQDGTLWAGGNGNGLFKFDGINFEHLKISDLPRSNYVTALLEIEPNVLLIGTEDGLYKLRNDTINALIPDAKLMRTYKFSATGSLFKDKDGKIWTLFDGQLRSLDSKTGMLSESFQHPQENDYFDWATLLTDGRFVIGCVATKRIYIFKEKKLQHTLSLSDCVNGYAIEDSEGFLWISTNKGFLKTSLADPTIEHAEWINTENGLPSSIVGSAFLDRERNLWFASFGKGIFKLEETETYRFSYPFAAGLACPDSKGRLWFSTPDGLRVIGKTPIGNKKGHWLEQHLKPFPDKYFKSMGAVIILPDNQIWLGCDDGGLVNFNIHESKNGTISLQYRREISARTGFPDAKPIWIFIDSKYRLWYSENNIAKLHIVDISSEKPHLIKTLDFDPGARLSNRREITEDKEGNFWFAYETGKVLIFNKDLQLKNTLDGLPLSIHADINCLHRDLDGSIWFGTNSEGLIRHTVDGKNIHIDKSRGLISNKITEIIEGPDRCLWIATWNGLAFVHYDKDSIRIDENREVTQSPIWSLGILPDSMGWVATNFEVVFHKRRDARFPFNPPAVLHKIFVNGKERTLENNLKLSADENQVVIEYGSISLQSRAEIRFSYKLEGATNSNWSFPSTIESVNFAILKPGQYTFKVKAMTSDGLESITPASIHFIIIPPFWKQGWFIIVMIILIATIVWALISLRIRRLLEIERLRAHIAADLHDDIGSGLTRIALTSDMLLQQKSESSNSIQLALSRKIGSTARELIEAMSDIVWAINPKNDSLGRVAALINVFSNEICEAQGIQCFFKFDFSAAQLKPGSEIVICLVLIAKEAIHNVSRHSQCKNLTIEIKVLLKELILSVEDDGIGFNENDLSRINGLMNMRRRAEKVKGHIEIKSEPGSGTTIKANLPLL